MIRRGIGVQSFVSAGVDADAQAFITAAGITDATQQSAINTLVTDLKGYGVWTKMKAIYPFIGSSSSTQKWNLKDPRDLDAAFRLVFNGGWTHSSTGALPNGTNGYADTFLTPSTSLTNSVHFSFYSRTNQANSASTEMGCYDTSSGLPFSTLAINTNAFGGTSRYDMRFFYLNDANLYLTPPASTAGYAINTKLSGTTTKAFWNNSSLGTITGTNALPNKKVYIGARNSDGTASLFTSKQCAFASIGDGLTDTEAANLYTAVQAYQTTLGRSVGTQTVSDADAQAFVNAAVIKDQVQATAINTLVTDLKTYGIWSKMKAIYPFVGGTSSAHKWNLKDPRDLDAAFRLVFSGGWTHSSTGALPNGTNGYANTKMLMATAGLFSNSHLSYYSRTNTSVAPSSYKVEIGRGNSIAGTYTNLYLRLDSSNGFGGNFGNLGAVSTNTDARCFGVVSSTSSTSLKSYKNGVLLATNTNTQTNTPPTLEIYLGAQGNSSGIDWYTDRECAFASIGDGLTDTEAANLYTAVQAYQTSLSRNI